VLDFDGKAQVREAEVAVFSRNDAGIVLTPKCRPKL